MVLHKPLEPELVSLEELVKFNVYRVRFDGTGRKSKRDPAMQRDPCVQIEGPHGDWEYFGYMAYDSKGPQHGTANSVRQCLLDNRFLSGDRFGRVIGRSGDSAKGPYFLVGDLGETRQTEQPDFSAATALSVVRGDNVFYAEVQMKDDTRGNFAVVCYNQQSDRLFGFLDIVYMGRRSSFAPDERHQRSTESIITRELFERIVPGDRLLVTKIGDNSHLISGNGKVTPFFNHLINFEPYHEVYSPDGMRLCTMVVDSSTQTVKTEDIDQGDHIYDLPVLGTMGSCSHGTVGLGYVPRPKDDPTRFFYKPVKVIMGADNVGNYIHCLEIVEHNEGVIMARKIG